MIKLDFNKLGGLLPAIVQDYQSGEVLMLAFMNEEAWAATLSTGKATYYSRTRKELWVKGKTSGNMQIVKEIRIDCDNDTVLLKVEQIGGAACHMGYKSCFFKKIEHGPARNALACPPSALPQANAGLACEAGGSIKVIGEPLFDPEEVYEK